VRTTSTSKQPTHEIIWTSLIILVAWHAIAIIPSAKGGQTADPLSSQLQALAAKINARGMQQLDANTTFDHASAEGHTMTYHWKLTTRGGSDAELVAYVKKNILPHICGNPELRSSIDEYGVTVRYSYLFPDSSTPVEVDFDKTACSGQ
jgi:hypothetical protein